ncbi:MAG: RNA methyltransferase [Lawsonibacter sp.]|nr:RNA methyltransferase [Lawsonibacter sp.]
MEYITSRNNRLIKHIRKLTSDREYRRSSGLFFGEGPKLLAEALKAGTAIETVVTARGVDLPGLDGLWRAEVPADLLDSLCDTKTPQGVLFLAKMPDRTPPERLTGDRWLILDGLQDPGNVGTIWRTADGLGADGLVLVNHCADPFSPKTVRATMGACFRLPVYELEAEELPGLLARSGLPLYAAALRADTRDIKGAQLSRCAVVIGSEGRGVSPELLNRSEQTVKIPMRARCESLNAAVAAAVILWEMAR